jgi:hypothetical protein
LVTGLYVCLGAMMTMIICMEARESYELRYAKHKSRECQTA